MVMSLRRALVLLVAALAALLVVTGSPVQAKPEPAAAEPAAAAQYRVLGPRTFADRNAVAAHRRGHRLQRARRAARLRDRGRGCARSSGSASRRRRSTAPAPADGAMTMAFPPADSNYHDYAEMIAELNQVVADHPTIAQQADASAPRTRAATCRLIKISDNVATDENEPEILFNAHQHAREHLTVEMALYLLNLFTDSYGTDTRITNIVNSREIWIVPTMNPDGGEYDIATGSYRSWRKNRQPNSGLVLRGHRPQPQLGLPVGLLRRLVRHAPSSETYRGPSAFSAPETQRLRNFVNSRVIGGVQQIKANIDFHTYSRAGALAVRLHHREHRAGPERRPAADVRDPRRADGRHQRLHARAVQRPLHRRRHDHRLDVGRPRICAYTFEMYPGSSGGGGFYPPDEVIARADHPQPRGRADPRRVRRLPVPGDRQAGPVLRRRWRHDRLLRHLRDRDRLDDQPVRHRHGDHRRVGAR